MPKPKDHLTRKSNMREEKNQKNEDLKAKNYLAHKNFVLCWTFFMAR